METSYYRINEICDVKSGKRLPKGADFVSVITPYKYIRARDIKKGKVHSENVTFIDEIVRQKICKYIINKDDIAITIVANIGDVGICGDDCDNSNLTENAVRLTNYDLSIVYPKYLNYYLSQHFMKEYMENLAIGAAQAKLGIYKIQKIKISLPDVNVQKSITEIISRYDELIEINNKRIKLLEQTVENYFKLSYENEIKNHRVNIVKLSELLDITRGLSYSSEEIECDDGVTLINLKNIQGFGGFRRDGNKCYNGDYKETQVVKQGDLVMGVTDMTQDRRTVGSVALIPDIAGVCVISADLIKIETDINKSFLYCLFRFGNVSKYISQFANGANVLHLKPEVIKKVKIMMPTQEYINAFSRIVTPMLDEIEMLYQQNDNLIKQRDLLLPRLMSGKLSVETKTKSVPKVKKVISFDEFCSNMGMAARAKTISDEDLRAMYEAYIDDNATE